MNKDIVAVQYDEWMITLEFINILRTKKPDIKQIFEDKRPDNLTEQEYIILRNILL